MLGVWKGHYTYNAYETLKVERLAKVSFTISIYKSDKDSFSGTVVEDHTKNGMIGTGKIEGTIGWNQITFKKMMPIDVQYNADGSLTTNKNKKHPILIYGGILSDDKKTLVGEWKFKNKGVFWRGIIPTFYSMSTGNFEMVRQ